MQTRYLKILIIVILFFMIIGYAYINAALFVKSGVTLGFNFDEASVYLSNLNVNGINKYSSLSDDKNSFSIDVENGISSIDYYVANNSTQYDEFITLSCDNGTLNGVLLTFDDNNVDKINPQSIIKNSFIITNKGIEIARIISPKQAKKRSLNNLVGILPSLTDKEIENIKNERISKQ